MLELPKMIVRAVHAGDDEFRLEFDGRIIKVMDGAAQRTLWAQSGRIVIRRPQAENADGLRCPLEVMRGDIQDNVYVHRDMIRLPLHDSGQMGLELHLHDVPLPLIVRGEEMEVQLCDTPKYIGHID